MSRVVRQERRQQKKLEKEQQLKEEADILELFGELSEERDLLRDISSVSVLIP